MSTQGILLQMEANHHDGHRGWAWNQASSESKHGNLPCGYGLPDKLAFDVLSMGPFVSVLVSAIPSKQIIPNIMCMVMMGMAVPVLNSAVCMVIFREAHLKTMVMVAVSNAHDCLKFVGFRNFLYRLQERPRAIEFKDLPHTVLTECFNPDHFGSAESRCDH